MANVRRPGPSGSWNGPFTRDILRRVLSERKQVRFRNNWERAGTKNEEEAHTMKRLRQGRNGTAQEAQAAQASEGRWPRICARAVARTAPEVRCAHVL